MPMTTKKHKRRKKKAAQGTLKKVAQANASPQRIFC
jgi:hypothetical protein